MWTLKIAWNKAVLREVYRIVAKISVSKLFYSQSLYTNTSRFIIFIKISVKFDAKVLCAGLSVSIFFFFNMYIYLLP